MPLLFTRTLLMLLSLLSLVFLSYISLITLSRPSPSLSPSPRQSTTNFLFPSTAIISLTDDNSTCFLSRPAAFGPPLPKTGLKGELFVLEEGQLACDDSPGWDPAGGAPADESSSSSSSSLTDGTDDTDYMSSSRAEELDLVPAGIHADIESLQQSAEMSGRIVLVARGGCGFLEKVLWAQRRGAVALIVGDYKRTGAIGSGGLVTMYAKGDTSNVTIPSIFTTHTTARLLTSLLPHDAPLVLPPQGSLKATPVSSTGTTARTTTTTTSSSTSTSSPTTPAPHRKSVHVDSSHRPPMSGELEGIIFVVHTDEADDVPSSAYKDGGLWITLTPTSMSTSPFFDTLLVLVVSPLVTLTVVYGRFLLSCLLFVFVWLTLPTALLLIRSMIRRRRWRAPKSVVDRLPVRTYQTTATTPAPAPAAVAPPRQPHPPRSSSLPAPSAEPKEEPRRSRYMGGAIECVVCLEEYVDGVSRVMKLPCGHEFHAACITPWLTTRRRTCPICKGDVVRGTTATTGASSSSSWRHSDAGEASERTPLVGEE